MNLPGWRCKCILSPRTMRMKVREARFKQDLQGFAEYGNKSPHQQLDMNSMQTTVFRRQSQKKTFNHKCQHLGFYQTTGTELVSVVRRDINRGFGVRRRMGIHGKQSMADDVLALIFLRKPGPENLHCNK